MAMDPGPAFVPDQTSGCVRRLPRRSGRLFENLAQGLRVVDRLVNSVDQLLVVWLSTASAKFFIRWNSNS